MVIKPLKEALLMHVLAFSREGAYQAAKNCNKHMHNGRFSHFLLEQFALNEWLVILAHSEEEALEAKDRFYKTMTINQTE